MKLFYPPKHQPTPSLTAANKNNICNQQVPCLQQVGVGSAYLPIQQVGVGSTRLAYPRFQATLSSKILLAFLHFLGPHLHRNRTPLIFSSKNGSTPLPWRIVCFQFSFLEGGWFEQAFLNPFYFIVWVVPIFCFCSESVPHVYVHRASDLRGLLQPTASPRVEAVQDSIQGHRIYSCVHS